LFFQASADTDPMTFSIEQGMALCRLLADPSRIRLLLLLDAHELTVAELTQVTGLTQSRVSTHLANLRRAGLVDDRRVGAAAYYRAADLRSDDPAAQMWALLRARIDDHQARLDLERAEQVIGARRNVHSWAESVAGRMELHYSPGRTWEATARALITLLDLGDVLDIASGDGVLAELLARKARSVTCADVSLTLVAAARRRLVRHRNVAFVQADMHRLPLPDARYDQVFLMHALAYTREPRQVIAEAARMLRRGGRMVIATLNAHEHEAAMRAYDHVNSGIPPERLRRMLTGAGLDVSTCRVTSREPRAPYFEVVTALALKPSG
jgi:ubiquinone/menaquinone biosynthesis C-methylase UbiE